MNTATRKAAGSAHNTTPARLSDEPYAGRFVMRILGTARLSQEQLARKRTTAHCTITFPSFRRAVISNDNSSGLNGQANRTQSPMLKHFGLRSPRSKRPMQV